MILSTASAFAEVDRRMVITFDDLPAQRAQSLTEDQVAGIIHRLVPLLLREKVPVIGFVNEKMLEVDGRLRAERVALLESWLDAGLELGNHSYSHPDLHLLQECLFVRDFALSSL